MSGDHDLQPFQRASQPELSIPPDRSAQPIPQIIRDPFPDNVIPQNLIDQRNAQLFLKNTFPGPTWKMGMMGCGMTMMGAPTVVGAGMDCNNYLDVRNAHHETDQAHDSLGSIFERRRQSVCALFIQQRARFHAAEPAGLWRSPRQSGSARHGLLDPRHQSHDGEHRLRLRFRGSRCIALRKTA